MDERYLLIKQFFMWHPQKDHLISKEPSGFCCEFEPSKSRVPLLSRNLKFLFLAEYGFLTPFPCCLE